MRINKHVQIIDMIITVAGRIPADITNRLGKVAVTFTVSNAILFAFTDTLFHSLWEVTTGVPSLAKAKASEWISPVDTETSRNSF